MTGVAFNQGNSIQNILRCFSYPTQVLLH